VTSAPAALFDVDRLRTRPEPAMAAPAIHGELIVLGGHEPVALLDERAIAERGAVVRRRRGGGGAVHLEPGACWVEMWLPAGTIDEQHDLRATAHQVGGWWREALRSCGVVAEVHRDEMIAAEQGAIACFAGLGPGELTVAGRKLVGVSQWRSKDGVLVSSVVARRAPLSLAAHLADRGRAVPRLAEATSLAETAGPVAGRELASAFKEIVSAALPGVADDDAAFA
jgi:lipoate-protein ligase A